MRKPSPALIAVMVAWLVFCAAGTGRAADETGRAERFARAAASVVAILPADDVIPVIYATAIAPRGLVATKASAIEDFESLVAQHRSDGETAAVTHRWIDRDNDIAVLQTEFENLPAIGWSEDPAPAQPLPLGTLVMANDPGESIPRLGVIAAIQRPIEKKGAALGVRLEDRSRKAQIQSVFPDKAADRAGLLAGDVILEVDGAKIGRTRDLQDKIFSHDPGDTVTLLIERSGVRETLEVRLGYQSDIFDLIDRNQLLSGPTSRRRSGYAEVLQHDIPLSPTAMGTPLLDIEGRAIGLNIARIDRVTTYALPAGLVKERLAKILAEAGQPSHPPGE